ncbi:hypothetical protein D8674_005630 [Pyrus ussuriensis x Pyrus communis]|uniref:Aminotransferase-like plant mobile domain-containing protein n=1 Tax=Pyrus ussuriensis x Pyrus communis TaxID=2448454 RepID=A0A5N5FSC1_9ROSA|nr:hypothetical protein D8674_005630 [Pyrus ussuriensis x Pyrus communis]
MENPPESMVEEREELMVPPSGGNPFLKKAYFLKPTLPISTIDELPFELPHSFSSIPSRFEPKKWPLQVEFHGWRQGTKDWKSWVDQMASVHQSSWKAVGIYEAILNSTYQIRRQNSLVYGLAEKWCPETNTFIFPWGEATITLEDVMVLGSFSVLGDSVLSPLETTQLKEIEEELLEKRKEFYRSPAKKSNTGLWLKKFIKSGHKFEHEAFLVYWLSRYVFNHNDVTHRPVFSIAIHLARGIKIALAPAVLASIYKDLGLLKRKIVASNQLEIGGADLQVTLKSPFHLLQVWAWERFLELRPKANVINFGETRLARWDKLNGMEGTWVVAGPDSNDELLSFIRCLIVSELVGLGTIEHYLPHRVAMQFGFDQDIPCSITRLFHNSDTAWKYYNNEIKNVKLYLPCRLFEADVSIKYTKWWKKSVSGLEDASEAASPHKKKAKGTDRSPLMVNHPIVPPGFAPKCNIMEAEDPMDDDDKLTISEGLKRNKKYENFVIIQDSDSEKLSGGVSSLESKIAGESSVCTKSDKDNGRVVGKECASSSPLFESRVLEFEKRGSEITARIKRLESMLDELNADV